MQYNTFNRFQVLRAQDPEGLNARMDAFLGQVAAGASAVAEPPVVPPAAAAAPVNTPVNTPPPTPAATPVAEPAPGKEKPVEDKANEEEEDEVEVAFPVVGKSSVEGKPTALDETAFDAETDREAAQLEAKAAEKFKALRAELKTFKQREFKPDPEAIPEYKALKSEVEELRKAKEENEGLKSRMDSLMKASDELAVKESPEFISRVRKPVADMKAAIQLLADASSMDPNDFMAIVAEPDPGKQDKALENLESRLPRRTLSRLEGLCDDYLKVVQAEEELLADIPKSLAEARKQQAETEQKNRKLLTGQFQDAARKSFSEYGQVVPGFTDSTGALTDLAESVQRDAIAVDPHSLTPEDLGFMIFASKALGPARKEIARLTREVRSLKGGTAEPIPGQPPRTPKVVTEPENPHQTLADRMKGQTFTFNPSYVG